MKYRLKSGAAIAYAPGGRGDTTLVMLHPVGLRGAVWSKVAGELAGEYRTLAVDLPGHGESDVTARRQSIEDMAGSVVELIATVGGERVVDHQSLDGRGFRFRTSFPGRQDPVKIKRHVGISKRCISQRIRRIEFDCFFETLYRFLITLAGAHVADVAYGCSVRTASIRALS